MIRTAAVLLAASIALSGPAQAEDQGTPEQAIAMVKRVQTKVAAAGLQDRREAPSGPRSWRR